MTTNERDELIELVWNGAVADRVKDGLDPEFTPVVRPKVEALADAILAAGYCKSSDRRPSVVTDAANRVAYFLNWHQGDNDIAADFPSGPSLYASDLQVILNELKTGGGQVIHEPADINNPCCDECWDWATGADVDEQAKQHAIQDAINAAHQRQQWAQQGVFLTKRDKA